MLNDADSVDRYVSLPKAIAARYREIGTRSGARRWLRYLFETYLRLFVTIQFAIWAAFESDSWAASGYLCGAGLAVDIVRNFFLEHLRLTPDGIRGKIAALRQHGNKEKLETWRIANRLYFFVLFVLVMQFITFGPKTEHAPVPHYIVALMPLQQVTWHLSTTMRHIMTSLVEHHDVNRAGVSGFFFTWGTWVVLVYTCFVALGYGQEVMYSTITSNFKENKPFVKSDIRKIFVAVSSFSTAFFFYANFEKVDWIQDDPLLGIHLFRNNLSFLLYSLLYSSGCIVCWIAYLGALFINLKSTLDSFEHLANNPNSMEILR